MFKIEVIAGVKPMIQLDNNKKVPLYEQLFRELRKNILSGEYEKDQQLKPIRVLAKELKVSHNTVNRAYQQLLAEGYIRALQGSGFYVEEMYTIQGAKRKIAQKHALVSTVKEEYEIKYDFGRSSIANEVFPWSKWVRYLQNTVWDESYKNQVVECESKGTLELRTAICQHIKKTRAVDCNPDQIVVCPTTEHALEIITNILPQKEYIVGVEEPGSEKMRRIFINSGYKIYPVPTYENGIDANHLEKTDCNLLYLTPSFQFPTGVTVPLIKRLQMLEWCRRNGVYCIENDYENEFLFGEQPVLSMKSLDRNDVVVYLSTFSYVLTSEIKCAFVVLPMKLLQSYNERYRYFRASMSNYAQHALAQFINDGNLERQSRKVALLIRKKKEIFINYIKENLSKQVICYSIPAGSHCLIRIPKCRDADLMAEKFMYYGINIISANVYWYNKDNRPNDSFLMCFGAIREKEMQMACISFENALNAILAEEQEA